MIEQSKPINLAVSYINEIMDTDFIFCFGSRFENTLTGSIFNEDMEENEKSMHFDLLVITPDDDTYKPDFTGNLETFSDMLYTVTTLVRTRTQVQKELIANNRFFHKVISKAELVYSKNGEKAPGFSGSFYASADYQKTVDYWKRCCIDMDEYLALASNSKQAHIAVPLLNKCMKAGCRGLLFVMLGYAAEECTLNQLLNLCDLVDVRFQNIIPLLTSNDQYDYEVLMNGSWQGNYGEDREPMIPYLYKYCDDFTKLTKLLCEFRLESMKTE